MLTSSRSSPVARPHHGSRWAVVVAAAAGVWVAGCTPAKPRSPQEPGAGPNAGTGSRPSAPAADASQAAPRAPSPNAETEAGTDASTGTGPAASTSSDAGAAPAPIASPVERGPLCVAWRDRVCQALGDYHQGCRRVDEAANFLPDAACAEAMKAVDAQVAYFHALRKPCEDLVGKLCADLGPDAKATCEQVRRKTGGFGNARCQMMLQDYATVLDEVRSLAGERRVLTAADLQAQRGGGAPHIGPGDSPLAVIFYGDFECPFCAKMADVFRGLVQRWGKDVMFVYRNYPLKMHEHAQLAAEAAMAAHAQGKFWPYFDALYAKEGAPLTRDVLLDAAKEVGLDVARFTAELDGHKWAQRVKEDRALGTAVGAHKTPSFLVGRRRIFGTATFESLSTAIEEELKEQRERVGSRQDEPSAVPE